MRAGPWTIEVIRVRGRDWFRVKYHGYLHGGGSGWQHGLYTSVEEVATLLGDDFARLQDEPEPGGDHAPPPVV